MKLVTDDDVARAVVTDFLAGLSVRGLASKYRLTHREVEAIIRVELGQQERSDG